MKTEVLIDSLLTLTNAHKRSVLKPLYWSDDALGNPQAFLGEFQIELFNRTHAEFQVTRITRVKTFVMTFSSRELMAAIDEQIMHNRLDAKEVFFDTVRARF